MLKRDFWNEKHRISSTYWLTKTVPDHVFIWHRLSLPTGKRVMDIGIGNGALVQRLRKAGNDVVACDISPVALQRVAQIAQTVDVDDLRTIAPVDLAICHLVFQHCTALEMCQIIRDVRLTPGGLFSFQFAYLASKPSPSIQIHMDEGHLVFRPLESVLADIATMPWLTVVRTFESPVHHFEGTDIGWHFVQVKGAHP
jgi:SAM-dependent methyltransferase